MTPERRIVLDLARTPLNDRQAIAHLMTRAGDLAKRLQASKARRKVKAAPRIVRERATKAQRAENWQATRAAVLARANGRCEFCGSHGFDLDCHHLAAGPLRRKYEAPNCTVGICRLCHRNWHNGNLLELAASIEMAEAIGAPDIVKSNLNRRLQKAAEPHLPATTKESNHG